MTRLLLLLFLSGLAIAQTGQIVVSVQNSAAAVPGTLVRISARPFRNVLANYNASKSSQPGVGKGAWVKPGSGESLSPDLDHLEPYGPHWDYRDKYGPSRTPGDNPGWRIWPDGSMTPKKNP